MAVEINPSGCEETIEVFLDKRKHPKAYGAKKRELIECGMSEAEAERHIAMTPFIMELYYSECNGLYMVESEALECTEVRDPYTGEVMTESEEE